MPKQVPANAYREVEDAVRRYPAGAGLADLLHDLPSLSRRTLTRRVNTLVKEGRLRRQGEGPATKYAASLEAIESKVITPRTAQLRATGSSPELLTDEAAALSLSVSARDHLEYVTAPIARRRPVGYQRSLLDDYVPNTTEYLSDRQKSMLHRMGSPIEAERPAGTFARDILSRLLIDLSWASSRLEGNTYTRLDTERLIQFGEAAAGKDATETQMILNHKQAIELLVQDEDATVGVNEHTLLNLHAVLSDGLMADPEASGRLRRRMVEIRGSVYIPTGVPQLIEECFASLIAKARAIVDPFECAFFLLVHIPYLQPFEDVNKRVSRLAANIPLIKANLSPLSFIDVPEKLYIASVLSVYETMRLELMAEVFIWAYERSCQKYVVVRDSVIEPDLFRLRYRSALSEVVRRVIESRMSVDDEAIATLARDKVADADLKRFVTLAVTEIARLHEGNIARHKLRLSDFRAWRTARPRI